MRADESPALTAVFSAPFLGGSELFSLEYLRAAHDRGVRIDAVIPDRGAVALALAPVARSVRVARVPGTLQAVTRFDGDVRRIAVGAAAPVYALRLARALRGTRGPVLALGLRAQLGVAMLEPLLRRRVAWVIHELVPPGALARRWGQAARRADALYAYSRSAAGQPLLRGAKVEALPVRLDLEPMERVEDPAPPPRVLGLVGDLFELKNHLELVELVRRLRAGGSQVEGLLVGRAQAGDPYAARVLAAAADPANHVRHIAVAPESMPEVMAQIDILCHLSVIPESFGRVCAEAMAAGRPVVAFDHGAVAEIVRDGETGALCPPGDMDALEAAVAAMLDDEKGFTRLSVQAREHAVRGFGSGQTGRTIAEALVELSAAGSPGSRPLADRARAEPR